MRHTSDDRYWAPGLHGHLPALDGLRGVAILLVIASHYLGDYYRTASVGWTGVNLFFVLSGFLITGILLDAKGSTGYFRNFYARRTLRIFPLYYLVLLLIFVVAPRVVALNTSGFREAADAQGWLWSYTTNIHTSFFSELGGPTPFNSGWVRMLHLWSLAVEEQFYLVWPAVVWMVPRRKLAGLCVVCFFGAWACRWGFVSAGNYTAPYFFTLCRMDDIAAGAFVAVIARDRGGLARLRSWAPWLTVIALWALVGTGVQLRHFFQLHPDVELHAYSAFALLYACVLVFALTTSKTQVGMRLLEMRWLRSYGKYSYAIYIFHWGLSEVLFARIAPLDRWSEAMGSQHAALLARMVVVAVVSYGIAWVSWQVYERHFLRLKARFYSS